MFKKINMASTTQKHTISVKEPTNSGRPHANITAKRAQTLHWKRDTSDNPYFANTPRQTAQAPPERDREEKDRERQRETERDEGKRERE